MCKTSLQSMLSAKDIQTSKTSFNNDHPFWTKDTVQQPGPWILKRRTKNHDGDLESKVWIKEAYPG